MASTFQLGAICMAETPPDLEDAAAKMELAVMHALATFAGDAFRLKLEGVDTVQASVLPAIERERVAVMHRARRLAEQRHRFGMVIR